MAEKDSGMWEAFKLAGELGYLIAIPLVLFALAGRFLDKKFGTSPWLFIAGLLVSLFITSLAVYRKIIRISKQIEAESKTTRSETKPEEKTKQ